MKALIFGSTGQIASALKSTGTGFDILSAGRPDLDFLNPKTIQPVITTANPAIIINASAYTAVDQAEREPDFAFAVNRDGPAIAAKAARNIGAAFLHLSTDFVFDGSNTGAYTEDDLPNPLGVYGQSKYEGELAVMDANPDAVIIRLSWVYSANGNNFAKTMLRLAKHQDEISVVDDQRGRPSAAEAVAPALWDIARQMMAYSLPAKLYHLGPQGVCSWANFAEEIFTASAKVGGPSATVKRITTEQYPTPATRPANSVLNCTRIHHDLGILLPDWRLSCHQIITQIVSQQSIY